MLSFSLRDPHVIGALAASAACAGGVTLWLKLRRKPDPEELERERRAQLVRSGRIMDGTILDVTLPGVTLPDVTTPDVTANGKGEVAYILYHYEIGGVEYECSQDVSALRDYVKAEDLRLTFPCSVRYDVRRPENSIVVAENWSGLRRTARSVPTRNTPTPRTPTSAHAAP